MEEVKTIDPTIPIKSEISFNTPLWQWQSGPSPDPWAEKDETKWTWRDYSYDDCLVIEEAFSLNKAIADLKDYEVDLKKMVQVNKKSKNRTQRVRRQEKSRFMMEMSEPVAIVRDQKTMNQAFGTIQHFLEYIMKRTPEAYGLYQRLKTLRLDSKNYEFEDIIQEILLCIEKGAEIREKTASQKANFIGEAKKVVKTLLDNSAVLGDFLKAILRVYTMETFICYWLNELLRSEDWEEINVLAPYLICLVYTFKRSEYTIKHQKPQGFADSFFAFIGKQRLYLYRGSAIAQTHLELYHPDKVKYFSWNGVTSTSRDETVALNFIRASLTKAKKLNEPKVGVFFKIKTDFVSLKDCEGMIDIFENACSEYPDEKEVILAPGTVFRLRKFKLIENNIYKISLQIERKFQETKDKVALLGLLQNQAILKDKAIIDGLPSQQSFRLLEILKGNKLIQKLEIRNSGVEDHIMEEIETLRATTNVKKKDVKLKDNMVVVSSLGLLAYYFSEENLKDIFIFNKIRFKEKRASKDTEVIKSLILSEEALEKFQKNKQLKQLGEKIKDENQMENLDISIKKLESANNVLIDFLQSIGKNLQDLTLRINKDHPISRECLEILCQIVRPLNRLFLGLNLSDERLDFLEKALVPIRYVQNLSIDFQFSKEIKNQGLSDLNNVLMSLTCLRHLSLDFSQCEKISDDGLNNLKTGLASLHYLSLNFSECHKISDKGLEDLQSVLKSLNFPQHLSLNFSGCNKISDQGLNHLKNGLTSLYSLRHLSLNFEKCNKISDKGLNHLIPLASLRHLSLNFANCSKISDQGLAHILRSLTSLEHLCLNFSECYKISDEGLNHLKNSLNSLNSLNHLSLNFQNCKNISDEGFNHLKSGLTSLTSLENLSLNFRNISDEGLNYISSGFTLLTSLHHLSLSFSSCDKISNEGLKNLGLGLKTLVSLSDLSLNFIQCNKISLLYHLKIGLKSLSSLENLSLKITSQELSGYGIYCLKDELRSLTSLQHLSLDFSCRNFIADYEIDDLKSFLFSLSSIQGVYLNIQKYQDIIPEEKLSISPQNLFLDFQDCNFTDNGLNNFKSCLIPLTSLQHLSLRFVSIYETSDEGLNHLKSGLIPLTSLHHLSLNFSQCDKISDNGINHIQNGLRSLISLQHLSLNFSQCNKISDDGLNHLKSGLIPLISLLHLSLNFSLCDKISDKGLKHLKGGLVSLASLCHLSVNFAGCSKISDEGFNHLTSSLLPLTSLHHLSLKFSHCEKISDEGLKHLKSSLLSLTSLDHLSLDFPKCQLISHEGINHLKNGLISLTSLSHLSLNFKCCDKISDEGLNHLKSALISLTSLQHFSLNLYMDLYVSQNISDKGLNHLKNGLIALTSLRHLSLNFYNSYEKVSDQGFNLLTDGLNSLTSLNHLDLNFTYCRKISAEGFKHLKSSLISLTSLRYLSLTFQSSELTGEGINHLKSGLTSLNSLHQLSLDFSCSSQISDSGLNHLKNGLTSLTSLENLSLLFDYCPISDDGLDYLKSGFISLTSLHFLSMGLSVCRSLSDKGLNHLKSGLIPLSSLQSISLNVKCCERISEKARTDFLDEFKSIHCEIQH